MKPNELRETFGFNDIALLPATESTIEHRSEVVLSTKLSRNNELKIPLILSPMSAVSDVDSCVAMNKIGAAGILHRFMPLEERIAKAKQIKEQSGKVYVAVGLNDNLRTLNVFIDVCEEIDCFFLDIAHGTQKKVYEYIELYKNHYDEYNSCDKPDLITGNTLTYSSVERHFECQSDGVRHGIGIGGACLTWQNTAVGCPALTANYYAWKGRNNWHNRTGRTDYPTILQDGGIRFSGDLVKSIASGCDAVICGRLFAGCKETPGKIIEKTNYDEALKHKGQPYASSLIKKEKFKEYFGMASAHAQQNLNKEKIYVEGAEGLVPYTGKSVVDVVEDFCDGLRSCMSYLDCHNIEQLKGAIWDNRVIAIRVSPNATYESSAFAFAKI